jgi:hypothetical protein
MYMYMYMYGNKCPVYVYVYMYMYMCMYEKYTDIRINIDILKYIPFAQRLGRDEEASFTPHIFNSALSPVAHRRNCNDNSVCTHTHKKAHTQKKITHKKKSTGETVMTTLCAQSVKRDLL